MVLSSLKCEIGGWVKKVNTHQAASAESHSSPWTGRFSLKEGRWIMFSRFASLIRPTAPLLSLLLQDESGLHKRLLKKKKSSEELIRPRRGEESGWTAHFGAIFPLYKSLVSKNYKSATCNRGRGLREEFYFAHTHTCTHTGTRAHTQTHSLRAACPLFPFPGTYVGHVCDSFPFCWLQDQTLYKQG